MILRNEYPRPQFKREDYQVLNGEWNFDFDDENKFFENGIFSSLDLKKKINVPFAFQTTLSGIHDLNEHENMIYERVFDLEDNLRGKRIILNFNAVDNYCKVYINGKFVGEHEGGYTAFSFDVSEYIKDKDNHLVVYVKDPYDPTIPRGKQYWDGNASRCWYNASSGIWQSVWLEAFNEDYIQYCFISPDIDTNSVKFNIESKYGNCDEVKIEIYYKGKKVRKASIDFEGNEANVNILLRADDYIDELHYWTVDNPNLYDVKLSLYKENRLLDYVETYFGFRKIHINENGSICLNNKKIYQRLILDQGYFYEGDLTCSSIEDIKNDILIAKEMGFNGARKHQKIEDPYFYYYADKLGFLVWAEVPSPYNFNHHEVGYMNTLIQRVVKQLYNHPSIITWVPFNESWGVRKALTDNKQIALLKSAYYLIKSLDDSRLVDTNDGWENVTDTDFISIHDYSATGDGFDTKYQKDKIGFVQPMGRKLMAYGETFNNQPVLLTEYGGLSMVEEVGENFFGYHVASNEERLLLDLEHLQNNVRKCDFQGFCYTQLTDVKQETNGLLDAKHHPKYDTKVIRKIILGDYEGKDFFN